MNKGKKTNSSWTSKAANIFLKRQNEGEGKRKRRRAREKKKVGIEPAKDEDEGYHSDVSDGEDGGRVLSKVDKSILPGDEIIKDDNSEHDLKKKQGMSNWTDGGIGIKKTKSKRERLVAHTWHTLVDAHECSTYTFAITSDPNLTHKPSPDRVLNRKLTYLVEELWEDLTWEEVKTVEFWVTLAIFALCFWLRMYFHYMAEWFFLRASGVPLFSFDIEGWLIIIKYTSSNITNWQEIGEERQGAEDEGGDFLTPFQRRKLRSSQPSSRSATWPTAWS